MYRLKNRLFFLLILVSGFAVAQTQKLQKTYTTSGDVRVNIDSKNTNIVVENWDKNQVEITATLDANTKDAKQVLDNWKLEVMGGTSDVSIISGGGEVPFPEMDMASLNESMNQLGDIMKPLMQNLVAPLVKNIAANPLPPEFYAKMGNINFDYEAYKKDGDKYMKKFEKQMEENFGDDFDKSMEKWAAQFKENSKQWAKDSTEWKKNFEMKMQDWGDNFGKDMEKWGDQFGKNMEAWGQQYEKSQEGEARKDGTIMKLENAAKANKTIKIKMPKSAQLKLNVRYGEVKLGQTTTNLRADLSHSKLTASQLDGDKTVVHASYSPINISQWNYGILQAAYVGNCTITSAKSIKLESNSSNVQIGTIEDTGILSGNFTELKIGKLAPNFKNLDISLTNSDLDLSLPPTALNFNYKGTQSNIAYPKTSTLKSSKSYDSEIVNGYYKSNSTTANVNINASFSDVTIK